MIVAVTGGRDYVMTQEDCAWFGWQLGVRLPPCDFDELYLLHGAATGVDTTCGALATMLGINISSKSADWAKHGKAAGPIRNREMAVKCTICLAFPGGNGTQNMVNICRSLGKDVVESPSRRLALSSTPKERMVALSRVRARLHA